MSADILDMPIGSARQVAMIFANLLTDPAQRAGCVFAFYSDLPAPQQAAVLTAIMDSLNTNRRTYTDAKED